jgi:dephospho-CoA kinase
MLIVGLTGGIASGKTVVSQVLKEEGAYLIDADQIARELVEPHKPAWDELKRVFGDQIVDSDGSIHRKKLAAIVFSNPQQRDLLNCLLHPRIKEEMRRRVEEVARKDPEAIVVIDGALLVESGYYREMDQLIVVTSSERKQIERLRGRDGASREEAQRIISSQMPLHEKVKVADFVIENEGLFEQTKGRAKEVFQELKRLAVQSRAGLKFQETT